jgi:AcrR family transcriptional regulator
MAVPRHVPPTRPPRSETRRRLLEAGWEQLRLHGIHEASIATICATAGFTRGAFYSNFASKEDLFLELYADEIENRAERLRAGFSAVRERSSLLTSVSAQWMMRAVLDAFTDGHDTDRYWFILAGECQAAALRNPQLGARLAALHIRMTELLAAVIVRELTQLGLVLNLPIADAITIIGGLYETVLKSAMLETDYEEARRRTLDLIPRVLEPLVRVQEDLAPGAVQALRAGSITLGDHAAPT